MSERVTYEHLHHIPAWATFKAVFAIYPENGDMRGARRVTFPRGPQDGG